MGMVLVKKQKLEYETHAETAKLPTKWRDMNAWRKIIRHEIDICKKLDADVNFPTIHWMSYSVEHIRRHGALQQYSAERHEQAHKTILKDGWNSSNHNLNFLPQVITFQSRICCFEIREVNSGTLAQHRENIAATCKVLPTGVDLAAPRSSQLYAKYKFMQPCNRRDGMDPDAMINDFRALLFNTQDTAHRVTIYNGTWQFLMHKSHNKMYISDSQLHAMELCIYHGIKIQVEGVSGQRISQICWCTGSQNWCRGDQRKDWVWVK